ncbi:hypothetical protein A1Q1_01668 [Trichosporon asahii var. asahii CBS 2479]|uniref:Yos1-domain-containing protein n=1 Tax=Trichosporon asahii var. asahii (strain ATCC 90039 / CBS 2479 / JCM 2466 / KCTC 7840 / NBRC 103889/ NCYC 2677 / UAMH 7654) TaxID=1186058 RepID=J6F1Y4_TRIAS|nr:hypothetical protein A1Q1_01668 [Trichosporon asahii var. asahii CBS 2479]EJT49187.1 hypothetical protein A1Q1_01668 [Trichosporon asahii var. asahii CBS 2479]
MFGLGYIFKITLLLVNAVAILNEERFLARIGWSTAGNPNANAGFGSVDNPDSFGQEGQSMKAKAVNLIAAVRTLLRTLGASGEDDHMHRIATVHD